MQCGGTWFVNSTRRVTDQTTTVVLPHVCVHCSRQSLTVLSKQRSVSIQLIILYGHSKALQTEPGRKGPQ